MTEKEMMNQMQNLLGIRKKPSEKEAEAIALADSVDELAEMFCDSAIVLSKIASLLQGKKNLWDTKNFEDMDGWDEDDMACMDATVLFAVPGKPVQLMTEEGALSKFPGFDDEQTFYCVEIGGHLFLHYMEHTWESEEDITITAPVYHRFKEDGKRKEKYIPESEVAALREQIEQRKALEKQLRELKRLAPRKKAAVKTHDFIRAYLLWSPP